MESGRRREGRKPRRNGGEGPLNGVQNARRRDTHRVIKVHFSVVELGLEHERPGVGLLRQALDDHVQRVGAVHALHRVHDVHGRYGAEHVVRIGHGGRGERPVADHRHRVRRPVDQPSYDARQPVRVGGQRLSGRRSPVTVIAVAVVGPFVPVGGGRHARWWWWCTAGRGTCGRQFRRRRRYRCCRLRTALWR